MRVPLLILLFLPLATGSSQTDESWKLYDDSHVARVDITIDPQVLHINESYYGLYISVEHINDAFIRKHFADDSGNLWKCLYPADLSYLGENPQLYRDLNENGRPVYELKTNEAGADASPLVRLTRLLHQTPDELIPDSLEPAFDVPGFLQYLAMNVLLGSWDDYRSLMNNDYLYHDPSADRMTLIPYDYDNTFGVDWSGNDWSTTDPYDVPKVVGGARPLAERLLVHGQYRNLYTHFLQFYRDRVFRLDLWEPHIDSIRTLITDAALADTFRTLDYRFTNDDFANSYSDGPYQNQHVKRGIKEFVDRRVGSLTSLNMVAAPPLVYDLEVSPRYPAPQDSIVIIASCFGSAGIRDVVVQLTIEGETVPSVHTAQFSPLPGSQRAEDADRWITVLPPLGSGGSASFVVMLTDSLDQAALYPRATSILLRAPGAGPTGLVLNEFMADNDSVHADPAGDFDDWVEIHNGGNTPVLLTGMYLTDKPDNLTKWKFTQPDLILQPGEYLVVWCDEEQTEQGVHTNFKLSAGGEFLALSDADGVTVIDSLSFGPQALNTSFGRFPDGTGPWLHVVPSPGSANSPVTAVQSFSVPEQYALSAFRNPFNGRTTFRFGLSQKSRVSVRVYTVIGQEVALVMDGVSEAGMLAVPWEANIPSGMYLCRLVAFGEQNKGLEVQETIKVLLLR